MNKHNYSYLFHIVLLILFSFCSTTIPAWSPIDGVSICTIDGEQFSQQMIPDNEGGAIIVWGDARNIDYDIYAQKINNAGVPLWELNGITICNATNDNYVPKLTTDGDGGAIITWADLRYNAQAYGHHAGIFVQRVNSLGSTLWTANGIAICTVYNSQWLPEIISDDQGGAIIVWEYEDSYSSYAGSSHADVYAQRINSDGSTLWALNGIAICTATYFQWSPKVVSDGLGGAIITWQDRRNDGNDIYAQRIDNEGTLLWSIEGVPICIDKDSRDPHIISDGNGGAIISWHDYRSSYYTGSYVDVYAQRINSEGSTLWSLNGVQICTAPSQQENEILITDNQSGAIICWEDSRSYKESPYPIFYPSIDIYAQRIHSSGTTVWELNGIKISTTMNDEYSPQIAHDGQGGAFITWYDYRNGYGDIFAQHINSNGSTLWTINGLPVCSAISSQWLPKIIADNRGNAIISWRDTRDIDTDLYAQLIDAKGEINTLQPIADFYTYIRKGFTPLSVDFIDASGNNPNGWYWDFGDGTISTIQNPTHTYSLISTPVTTFNVKQIVSNAYGESTQFKIDYIGIALPIEPGFYATPTSGISPLVVNFVDTSSNNPTYWNWDFGDGQISNLQNPSHTYSEISGKTTFTVQLIASNSFGSKTITNEDYILVQPNAPVLVKLPDVKLLINQDSTSSFHLNDYNQGGIADTYSIISNFMDLSDLFVDSVFQAPYNLATSGINYYEAWSPYGSSTTNHQIKYSSFLLSKFPSVLFKNGLNIENNPIDLFPYLQSNLPANWLDPEIHISNSEDSGKLYASITSNILTITIITTLSSPAEIIITSALDSESNDYDKGIIRVYEILNDYGFFEYSTDTEKWSFDTMNRSLSIPDVGYLDTFNDASGITLLLFTSDTQEVKMTLNDNHWLRSSSQQWYTLRARVMSDASSNSIAPILFLYNGVPGNPFDVSAHAILSTPTTWYWLESFLYCEETDYLFPQLVIRNNGSPGNFYIDSIQLIPTKPGIEFAYGNTKFQNPNADWDRRGDTTGWGFEYIPDLSNPNYSVQSGLLMITYTGNTSMGLKITEAIQPGVTNTYPVTTGKSAGLKAKVNIIGNVNNPTVLLAIFGTNSTGNTKINELGATASVGKIPKSGILMSSYIPNQPYIYGQVQLKCFGPSEFTLDDIYLHADMDIPNFWDSSLFE